MSGAAFESGLSVTCGVKSNDQSPEITVQYYTYTHRFPLVASEVLISNISITEA